MNSTLVYVIEEIINNNQNLTKYERSVLELEYRKYCSRKDREEKKRENQRKENYLKLDKIFPIGEVKTCTEIAYLFNAAYVTDPSRAWNTQKVMHYLANREYNNMIVVKEVKQNSSGKIWYLRIK